MVIRGQCPNCHAHLRVMVSSRKVNLDKPSEKELERNGQRQLITHPEVGEGPESEEEFLMRRGG